MNIITKLREKLDNRPKLKQWIWFIALWTLGFLSVTILSLFIKFIFTVGVA